MSRKTVSLTVFGTNVTKAIVGDLIDRSVPVAVMPLPDDGYQIDVPQEHEPRLIAAGRDNPAPEFPPFSLQVDIDDEVVFVPAGTVLTPIHYKDCEYLCSHDDALIWIAAEDFGLMPIATQID